MEDDSSATSCGHTTTPHTFSDSHGSPCHAGPATQPSCFCISLLHFSPPSLSCLLAVCPLPNFPQKRQTRVLYPKAKTSPGLLCYAYSPSSLHGPSVYSNYLWHLGSGGLAQVTSIVKILRKGEAGLCLRQPPVIYATNSAGHCKEERNIQQM